MTDLSADRPGTDHRVELTWDQWSSPGTRLKCSAPTASPCHAVFDCACEVYFDLATDDEGRPTHLDGEPGDPESSRELHTGRFDQHHCHVAEWFDADEPELIGSTTMDVEATWDEGYTFRLLERPTLAAVLTDCHDRSLAAGWWVGADGTDLLAEVSARSTLGNALVAQKMMLITSEVAEAMEGHRKDLVDDHLPHRRTVEVELADAIIRIGDLAGALGLDVAAAVAEKLEYNSRRADHQLSNRMAADGKSY